MKPSIHKKLALACLCSAIPCMAAETFTLSSPGGKVAATVSVKNDRLVYAVTLGGKTMVADSPLGVTVDGADLGSGIRSFKAGEVSTHRDTYTLNGDESTLISHDQRVILTTERDGEPLVMELRAFDRGVGFRYIIPGDAPRTISGETTSWKLPAGAKLWYRTNTHGDYTDRAQNAQTGSLPDGKEVVGPLLAQLADGHGYVGITEADPWKYSGLSFKFSAPDTISAQFKYDKEWKVQGGSATPWRIVMTGADLNSVMEGRQLVTHLAEPHDPKLFPQGSKTSWIQPGRSAWSWLDPHARARGGVTVEHQKRFIDMAAELGFEYNTVDDGWEMWPDKWQTLAGLVEYAKSKNVKLFAWKDTADGDRVPDPADNYANLRAFLDKCRDIGLAGIKIDFLHGNPLIGEGTQTLSLMEVVYRKCAERQLMVNFHGAVKPTGQARTWPNAITQEPVFGMEAGAAPADATVTAFLCGLSGYCDYTPGLFSPGPEPELRGTSTWGHQLALGIAFCSPMQHWASGPELAAAAFPQGSLERAVYQKIPSTWDETIVLSASKPGELAAFARRKGKDWYVGVVNGSTTEAVTIANLELPFLASGKYQAVWVGDSDKPDAFRTGKIANVSSGADLPIKLNPSGGFTAILRPQ
jgi:alpha-glucosidase